MGSIPIDRIAGKVLGMDLDFGDFDRSVELSIFLDESISSQMAKAAKIALKPKSDNAIIRIGTYFDSAIETSETSELTIVFSNESLHTSEVYALSLAKGIPTVVITESVESLIAAEEASGIVIDESDVIILNEGDTKISKVNSVANQTVVLGRNVAQGALQVVGKEIPRKISGKTLVAKNVNFAKPEFEKTRSRYTVLFSELGDWICSNCHEAREPLSGSFEFIKESLAKVLATRTAVENAGTALLFFTSGADFPVMTANQLKMLMQINGVYGNSISKDTLFEAGAVVASAIVCKGVAKLLSRSIPNAKFLTNTLVAYFATALMGHYINMYCAGGKQIFVTSDFEEEIDEEIRSSIDSLIGSIMDIPAYAVVVLRGICEKCDGVFQLSNKDFPMLRDLYSRILGLVKGIAESGIADSVVKTAKNAAPAGKVTKFDDPVRIVFHADGTVDGLEELEELFVNEIGDLEGAR